MDKLIFGYYTKTRVETMRKGWRHANLENYRLKMMKQAVDAYHRKEYALTTVMLASMWEGIIYEKVNDLRRKQGKRTKQNFEKLVDRNDCDAVASDYFNNYIMYDCESDEQVIDDVPGRNSMMHSFSKKYPSKKAALNAILFTEFLLNLERLETEE